MVLVMWIQKKMSPLHNWVQMNQHCMFKKNLIWGLLLFWEKKTKKDKKKKNQTLQSDWFWDLCCHISLSLSHEGFPVFLCHNVIVFLFSSFWRIHGIHWHISDFCIFSVLTYGMSLPQFIIKCDSIYWQHCTNSTSHIAFLQSGSFVHMRGEILP